MQNFDQLDFAKSMPIWHLWSSWDTADQGLSLPTPRSAIFPWCSKDVLFWVSFYFPLLLLWLLVVISCFSPVLYPVLLFFLLIQVIPVPEDFSCSLCSDNPSVCVSSSELPFPVLCPACEQMTLFKRPLHYASHPRTFNSVSFSVEESPDSLLWHLRPLLLCP